MAQITSYKKDGKKSGTVELSSDIFEVKINGRMLELIQRLYANNKRTGTAHTKVRREVRGGGARPWRQKGTGRARVSSIRSPLWNGGGTIFGPRTREIYNTIPKEVRKKALIMALSKKFKEKCIVVVDDLSLTSAKTKEIAKVLVNLKIDSKSTLWVAQNVSVKEQRATNNLAKISLKRVSDVNAYHVLRKSILLIDKGAIQAIEDRLLKENGKRAEPHKEEVTK